VLSEIFNLLDRMTGTVFRRVSDGPRLAESGLPVSTAMMRPLSREEVFARSLAAMSEATGQADEPFVTGSIEVLGLDDVREALAARWPEFSEAVLAFAESRILAQLDSDDLCGRYGDATFVLCFASLGVEAARARADLIARDLRRALVSQFPQIGPALRVEPFVTGLDREELQRSADGGSLIESLLQSLAAMRHEAQQASRRQRTSLVNNFNLVFAPAIHSRTRVTIFNRAILETTAGFTSLSQFQALADPDLFSETLAELDYLLLTRALAALHKALKSRGGVIIIVPVNFRTLANRTSQDEYVRLLDMVPPAYKRLLGVEICGMPSALDRDGLSQVVERLRPHVKWIAAEVASLEDRGPLLGVDGLWALAYNLSGSNSADPRLAARLRQFVAIAAASRLSTLAHGANSLGAALAACEAGFTCVDGPAIHASSDSPRIATASMPQFRQAVGGRPVKKW